MMPLAGFATGKFSARTLTVCGFTLFVITFRYAAQVTNLQMSFAEASWLRVVQMMPLPFCFISITNAAYVGMPREQSNQVAGLINFVRNIGGSVLIAITNAQVTSRAMWHEQHLQQAMQPGSLGYQQHLNALTGFFGSHRQRQRRRHGIGPCTSSSSSRPHPGLSGRVHGAFVGLGGADRACLPARQEPPRRGSGSLGHALKSSL